MEATPLVLIDAQHDEAEALAEALEPFGYAVVVEPDPDRTEARVAEHRPSHVLVRLHTGDDACATVRGVASVGLSGDGPPLIFIADDPSVAARLDAVRAGAKGYLTAPVDTLALVDKLESLGLSYRDDPFRVLIVDDDVMISKFYQTVLEAAGMSVLVINDPMKVMRELADFRPELILLDHYMPDMQGRELAAVIRQEAQFDSIPIVFLSAEDDAAAQQRVMQIGGDDFLTKPIRPENLVSAVTTRARRFRALRATMMRDSLTGLLNHTAVKEQLATDIARMRRAGKPLSFCLIDLDLFKRVNDTYGHPAGDGVLKALGHLLKQRLRTSDVIGRYGGEEFAVVLPETGLDAAEGVIDEVRESWARLEHGPAEVRFTVTFSAGLAAFPDFPDAAGLTEAADKALYRAKAAGRNRVMRADAPDR